MDDIFKILARRCTVCGRILTGKDSVKRGYGCRCAEKAKEKEESERPIPGQMTIEDFLEGMEEENGK